MTPIDILEAGAILPRHHHAEPYAAVVLSGGYEEAGEGGRFQVEAGDVLIHAPFSSHLDRRARPGTTLLNLPLPVGAALRSTCRRIGDPDDLIRTAGRDPTAAVAHLLARLGPETSRVLDEIDLLAQALMSDSEDRILAVADEHGISRATLWRRLHAAYGVGPGRFRLEARARRAWRRLVADDEPLTVVALAEGYADQAHMTRDVRALTGRTPGRWRALKHSFKTCRT